MGCRILEGKEQGTNHAYACFFCSTTGVAFGPLFDDADEATAFAEWLGADKVRWTVTDSIRGPRETSDPRAYSDRRLMDLHSEWYKEQHAAVEGS